MLPPAHSKARPCSTEQRVRRATGAANADETGSLVRIAQEPFIHRKKSLPGLSQKNAIEPNASPANRLKPTPGLEPGTTFITG
jgi:hypothetical protein